VAVGAGAEDPGIQMPAAGKTATCMCFISRWRTTIKLQVKKQTTERPKLY
jgi:hypothetical protein